ncbi:MAG: HEAT repeat domain-containing protein [Planctomycetota bacterium]|jgi:HEAT repeat protein
MRRFAPLHLGTLFALFFLASGARAGEGDPRLDPPAPEAGGAPVRETPADRQDPGLRKTPKKPKEDTAKRLERIRKALGKDGEKRDQAVEELLEIEDPRAVNVLVLALEKLSREARNPCFRRLCELGELGIGDKVPEKVQMQLQREIKIQKANAEPAFCTIGLDFLIPRKTKEALAIVSVLLTFPMEPGPLLDLLPKHGGEATAKFMAKLASDPSPDRPRVRAASVDRLGRWWSNPPLYGVKIPALLDALSFEKDRALRALQGITFPDFEQPGRWKRWWNDRKKLGGDLDILQKDFEEEFRRVHDRARRERRRAKNAALDAEAAGAVASWTAQWSAPEFRWACPLLHELLVDGRYQSRQRSIVTTLGRIADPSSLAPLHALRDTLSDSESRTKYLVRTVVDALGRAGASAKKKDRDATGEKLLSSLGSTHRGVIAATAKALGRLKYAEGEKPLLELVTSSARDGAACAAAEALGEIGATGSLDALLEVFGDIALLKTEPEVELTLSLLKAFRTLDTKSNDAVAHLIDALKAENERVCLETIRLVGSAWKILKAIDPLWLIFEDRKRTLSLREEVLKALAAYSPGLTADYLIEALAMEYGKEERFGKEFHALVRNHFGRPGTLLPEHQSSLLHVVANPRANPAGRVACLELLGKPGLWSHDRCVDPVASVLEADSPRALQEAARDALRTHPSRAALKRMVDGLPDSPGDPWTPRHDCISYVVDWYRIDLDRFFPVPDHGRNGKKWRRWLKRNWERVKVLDDLGK